MKWAGTGIKTKVEQDQWIFLSHQISNCYRSKATDNRVSCPQVALFDKS